jgi:hypothetical protein
MNKEIKAIDVLIKDYLKDNQEAIKSNGWSYDEESREFVSAFGIRLSIKEFIKRFENFIKK